MGANCYTIVCVSYTLSDRLSWSNLAEKRQPSHCKDKAHACLMLEIISTPFMARMLGSAIFD